MLSMLTITRTEQLKYREKPLDLQVPIKYVTVGNNSGVFKKVKTKKTQYYDIGHERNTP